MTPKPLPGNKYFSTALQRLDGINDWQSREGETDATAIAAALDAQAQATLASVQEQRTANLLQLEVLMAGPTGRGRRGSLERIGERMEEQEAPAAQEEPPTMFERNLAFLKLECVRGEVDQLARHGIIDAKTHDAMVSIIEKEQAR